MVELQPSNSRALERLVVLALEAGDSTEANRLQKRKAEIDRAKNSIRRLVVTGAAFRSHAAELVELSAVQGRPFDQHAWSLVAESLSGQPPGPDSSREQSQTFCRTVSDKAFAHLLTRTGRTLTSQSGTVADRLADLRGASGSE